MSVNLAFTWRLKLVYGRLIHIAGSTINQILILSFCALQEKTLTGEIPFLLIIMRLSFRYCCIFKIWNCFPPLLTASPCQILLPLQNLFISEKLCKISNIPIGVRIHADNGTVGETNQEFDVGRTISFTCVNPNNTLIGSTESVCLQNGTWSSPFPRECSKLPL